MLPQGGYHCVIYLLKRKSFLGCFPSVCTVGIQGGGSGTLIVMFTPRAHSAVNISTILGIFVVPCCTKVISLLIRICRIGWVCVPVGCRRIFCPLFVTSAQYESAVKQ